MTKLGSRSGSQILRTFLPAQTVDLRGAIYRVNEWSTPNPIEVDSDVVRWSLLTEIGAWTANDTDGGMAGELLRKVPVEVVELDERRGVTVESYPRIWLCRVCKRIGRSAEARCKCGKRSWGQLHFVGVHECGAITEPWIRRCPQHDDVRVVVPRSAKAADIRFVCPVCDTPTMQGLGFHKKCGCGAGTVRWNVHKARMVYVPRGMVLINPARPEHRENLNRAGGTRRALIWVVEGLQVVPPTAQAGQLAGVDDHPVDRLPPTRRAVVEREAVDIAMALAESRTPTTALRLPTPDDPLEKRYREKYPPALRRAGIDGLDLVDRFPILNAMYGYTRGEDDPSKCRLVPFRRKWGGYRLYGNLAETEAFLVRLDPIRVATWLAGRGRRLPGWTPDCTDPVMARVAILESALVPDKRDDPRVESTGADVLKLIHTYAHRLIRQTAVFSGIERDALSEYLVPHHLGFFLYPATRSDFVLGGMQAVFESNLDDLLTAFVAAEHRCPLDPGCGIGSGACAACTHLGEPSCRFFNLFLDRGVLFGQSGYLRSWP
ncbi:hypothetical protein [Salinispora cortesiana]|uniref:hypothetical protein n=1 Tax=Salinispora cortesiana TaxID=1305843 RepID=UPI0003FBA4B9|nr:hypothetical protein [Salinispora cortesiana]